MMSKFSKILFNISQLDYGFAIISCRFQESYYQQVNGLNSRQDKDGSSMAL